MTTSVAIVGARGFVGSALCEALSRFSEYTVIPVTRADYEMARGKPVDILVNAAMPSGRFWARKNPAKDFVETVGKTADLLYGWQHQKFVQISTVSARCEQHTLYGRHKLAAENLCDPTEHLIVRLSAMYSDDLQKGALIDILNGAKVYVSGASRYPFAPVAFVADWIARNLHQKGVVEVGARNTVCLTEIAEHLKADISFEGAIENQELVSPASDFPDAYDVFKFLDARKSA